MRQMIVLRIVRESTDRPILCARLPERATVRFGSVNSLSVCSPFIFRCLNRMYLPHSFLLHGSLASCSILVNGKERTETQRHGRCGGINSRPFLRSLNCEKFCRFVKKGVQRRFRRGPRETCGCRVFPKR